MDDLEAIYNDTNHWTVFSGEEDEYIGVYGKCPKCGWYIKTGNLLMNVLGDIKLQNWVCKRCGEVEPYFDREFGILD